MPHGDGPDRDGPDRDGPDRDGADPYGDSPPEGWRIATGPEGGAVLHDLEAGDWRFEIRAMGLTDRGLSGGEIDLLLANNITAARAACRRLYGDGFDAASTGRRHALVSMAFNLGQTRLAGFKRLRAAVLAGDWDRAAAEALDSRWASQTGRRAAEVAALLRTR